MADIFREVDEELSRDRAMAAWRKYGKYVIVFAGVAVLAVAAFSGWQDYRERQRQAEGRAYFQAIDLVMKDDNRAATAAMAQIAHRLTTARPTSWACMPTTWPERSAVQGLMTAARAR